MFKKKVEKKPKNTDSTSPTPIELVLEDSGTSMILEPLAPLEIEHVRFNNTFVLEVLNDGKETETDFHCRLADGTTAHVPKSLFNLNNA